MFGRAAFHRTLALCRPNAPLHRYRYAPLPTPDRSRHIRLLKLHGGHRTEEVRADLVSCDLDSAPEFEALSYAWGEPLPKARIRCSAGYAEVGSSLHAALRSLRHTDRERYIWADALCINQGDVAERSAQVRLMGDIYAKARRTLIWLSEETEPLRDALAATKTLRLKFPFETEMHESGLGISDETFLKLSELGPQMSLDRGQFAPVGALLELAWFSRKWVIQEVVKSREPILMVGERTLPWDTLHETVGFLTVASSWPTLCGATSTPALATYSENLMLMASHRHQEPSSLTSLLALTSHFACTDPRDHLFGVVGMVRDAATCRHLQPDYSISIPETIRRFVEWSVEEEGSLDFLGLCRFPDSSQEEPSWLPQLGTPFPEVASSLVHGDAEARFRAGGRASIEASLADGGKLCLLGSFVGEIEAISTEPLLNFQTSFDFVAEPTVETALSAMKKTSNWIKAAMKIAGVLTPEDVSTEKFVNLVQTLTWAHYSPSADQELNVLSKNMDRKMEAAVDFVNACYYIGDLTEETAYAWERACQEFGSWSEFDFLISPVNQGRLIARTSTGLLASVPKTCRVGDRICIFAGSRTPHAVRSRGKDEFIIGGECYVYGLMYGEALQAPNYKAEMIALV